MSEGDLPARFAKYDGNHIKLKRIALTRQQVRGLPSFPAADKKQTPLQMVRRQSWASLLGTRRDGPTRLRDCVEREIKKLIEPMAWARCEVVNRAEQQSLKTVLEQWRGK